MRLYYKKIERCSDCPERIMRELRLTDKNIPYSKNADFCSVTNQELFDEIPTHCPLMEYQEKIEVNETGNVWVKIKGNKKEKCWCGNPIDYTNIDCATFGLCKDHVSDS